MSRCIGHRLWHVEPSTGARSCDDGRMATAESDTRTAYRTCPLCEAGCGLEITVRTGEDGSESVQRIRGDRDDVFSHGFICPKGSTLKQLHDDPDRLRRPLIRRDGCHVEATWDEAWAAIDQGLGATIARHGRESIAIYVGNPTAHSLSAMLYVRALLTGVGTRNRFSASTVDQMPRQVASGYVFGSPLAVPVPDLDRTDHLVLLGANPYASNGSMCTAPDFPGRIEAIRARGGKVVVVDPRRSKTAEEADEWVSIRPGTDALLLAAIANVLVTDGLADPGEHVDRHLAGLDEFVVAIAPFTPDRVAVATGVDAATIRRMAREIASAPTAAVYGRIGTTTSEFGSTASWLVDAVNILSGNLDRPGGVMFSTPVAGGPTTHGTPGSGRGFAVGRGHSRVSKHPEVMGEYPVAALAEEILEPGEGQVRAFITLAGNPVLSTPNSERLDAALDDVEFMVSIDMYLNETTRHADVILPPPSQLQRPHYDVSLLQLAIRNVANYSEPVLPLDDGQPDEWEIIAKLASIAQGHGADADPAVVDDMMIAGLVQTATASDALEHRWAEPGRTARRTRRVRPARPRAPARRDAPHGAVRRRIRIEPGRDVARRPARSSPRPRLRRPGRTAPWGTAHAEREDRAGASGPHRRPRSPGGGDRRARGEGHGARRPT